MKKSKFDILIIAVLTAASLFFMLDVQSGEKRLYLIDKNTKEEIKLEDRDISLDNGHVIIQVTSEGARFLESDCPNRICIKQGWVKNCGDTAVCVPKHLALVMECKEQDYDAISQ
ncbi:NusG domain II-containing protein [Seleniivibrio sp.]|uniref:NusG domain II-containing protein n=1 Tax=Seleniivibrio sp. TaxID=2898801 RepID=UPI0025D2D7F6|nr:NusG domain II-containing protein [Seleniivibrio sp.]MCD8552867.1 NusG domain II-containing protein [Seleniivibrio sp.]